MQRFLLLLFVALSACKIGAPDPASRPQPLDVVIVPGCPSNADGSVSLCQWERAIWAAALWDDGVTRSFITSGGAVYNRTIEAESLQTAMVALGVPPNRIELETQALHSDENIGYSLAIAREMGATDIGYATHDIQAAALRAMTRSWRVDIAHLPMDEERVEDRLERGLPILRIRPVPEDEWLPLDERERVLAERLGRAKRLPSWVLYGVGAVVGRFQGESPPLPPVIEPTLRGLRHRVDTAQWQPDERFSVRNASLP